MTQQTSFDAFAEERDTRDEHPDPWEFDEYGPTMNRPVPMEEMETLPGTTIDARELAGTALAPTDFELVNARYSAERATAKGYHPDDQHRPERVGKWRETVAELESGEDTAEPVRPKHPENVVHEYPDMETVPDAVPIGAEKAQTELANRFIRAVIQEHGHHDPTRRAFQNWAKATDDDRKEKVAYGVSVEEIARGNVDGQTTAEVILEWGESEHPDVLEDATREYNDRLREKCESQLEEEQRQKEARRFEKERPKSVGNWERFETDKPDAIVAYRAEVYGTPSVAIVYENGAGNVDVHESTWDEWKEAETADESKVNRHLARTTRDEFDAWRDLLDHLETFDADPFPAELTADNTHPDAGGETEAVTDGGEVVEPQPEPGEYKAGDTVRLIEDVAVGLNTAPNIIEAEVSSTGKSVMIPEDADSIHGSRRLDAETIFSGGSEYRDSTGYELYTPGRYRNKQRSNYGPGPQAGANEVSESDTLPEPTHWPEGDDLDDAPDECPECGAVGPWNDVGKPRCEHCGETIDPDEEDEETDETPDKWDLSNLDRGDVLILDSYRGEFVVTQINTFATNQTVRSVNVAKREGGEWRDYEIETLDSMDGPRLKVEREGETTPFVNVDDPDHARDFEIVGNDMDRVRRYIRDTRDH